MRSEPFVPPPYQFDRLNEIKALAAEHRLGALDLSIGAPHDPPPAVVIEALSSSGLERGYPPSWVASPGNPTGASEDLDAIAAWGRDRGIPIFSDECYVEFTWDREPQCILTNGTEEAWSRFTHSASGRIWQAPGPDSSPAIVSC